MHPEISLFNRASARPGRVRGLLDIGGLHQRWRIGQVGRELRRLWRHLSRWNHDAQRRRADWALRHGTADGLPQVAREACLGRSIQGASTQEQRQ
jgi:hypothetical protein